MAERIQHKDGTATIISDSYALYGEIQAPPSRPDDPTAWHPVTIDGPATCRRYGATLDELFDWVERYKFPKPCRRTTTPGWGLRRTTFKQWWDVEKLDQWDAQIRDLAARLPRIPR